MKASDVLLSCFVIFQTVQSFAQDINYQAFAEMRLGKDQPGIILRDIGNSEWEIIAIGSASIETRDGVTPAQNSREALLMAGAQARKALAEFIGGVRVKGFETAKSESQVVVDSTRKEDTQYKFSTFLKSQQQQDIYAFLRGTKQTAEWESIDKRQVFLAVAISPDDIRQSLSISESIAGVTPSEKFKVVGIEGSDKATKRVQAWGMAARTTESVATARRAAIYDALKLAVESVAGISLSGRTSVKNLERLKSDILSTTTGNIKSFIVLKEENIGENYRVLVEAEVQLGLGGDLPLILGVLGSPCIAVHARNNRDSGFANTTKAYLKARGIPIKDISISNNIFQKELRPGEDSASWEAGEKICLSATLEEAQRQNVSILVWCGKLYSGSEQLVRCINIATGMDIYRNDVKSMLFASTAPSVLEEAAKSIISNWEDESLNGTYVRCEVNNLSNIYRQSLLIQKIIKELDGTKSVTKNRMSAKVRSAVFEVRFMGTVHKFTEELMDAVEISLDDNLKKLDVLKIEGNVVCFTF